MNALGLLLALGLAGCGGDPSSTPLSPTPSSSTTPGPVVANISGHVVDTAFRPLVGARVDVVNGSNAGTTTATDTTGQFSLTGSFDATTRFRATMEDHVEAIQTFDCNTASCGHSLIFYLAPLAPPVDIAGDYTLTFVADAACADLPADVRTRTYTATIARDQRPDAPEGTSFTVTVGGATFLKTFSSFGIGVAANGLGFWLHGGHDPPLVEQIGSSTYVAFSGNAAAVSANSAPTTISAPFVGWIEYCQVNAAMNVSYNCGTSPLTGEPIPGQAVVYAHCQSEHHRLVLTKR